MNLFVKSALATATLVMGMAFTPDKDFEGVFNYTIDVSHVDPTTDAMMQGSKLTLYMKGNMLRSDGFMSGITTTTITNTKKPDDDINLLDEMGKKYQIVADKMSDSIKAVYGKTKTDIDYIDSTKVIAGYTCKKAIVKSHNKTDSSSITVYYTKDLPVYEGTSNMFKGLKGFPVQYIIKANEMLAFTYTLKSVNKMHVPDSVFTVPAGYKKIGVWDLMKEQMNSMQDTSGGGE
jgi:GLPGLI family protein